jgi:biotin transport system substrate-specific component
MRTPLYARASDLAQVALFAALTVALGVIFLPLPFTPVPITGQSLGPMLAGSILGARKGFLSQAVFLLLVAIGLPVLAGGRGGLGVLLGPSGGYIVGFALAAFAIGWLVERLPRGRLSFPLLLLVNVVGGIGLIHLPGVLWLGVVTGLSAAESAFLGIVTFLPGDTLKAVAAALAARAVWRAHDPRTAAVSSNASATH